MFLVTGQGGAVPFFQTLVNGTVLEETERGGLTVQVVSHHLKTVEQQGLPHHIEILRQGVHDVNASADREGLQLGIIVFLGKGIVHGFHKAIGRQPVGDGIAGGFREGFTLIRRFCGSSMLL